MPALAWRQSYLPDAMEQSRATFKLYEAPLQEWPH
jgi:hypothetical protein